MMKNDVKRQTLIAQGKILRHFGFFAVKAKEISANL